MIALGLVTAPVTSAQNTADTDREADPAVGREKRMTLFMVVKVGDNLTAEQVRQTILDGAKIENLNLRDTDVGAPRRVPTSLFDLVAANTGASGVQALEFSDEDVVITPLLSADPTWSITFKNDRLLKEISIRVDPDATITLKPGNFKPGDKKWLATVRPGREYVLRLPQDVSPREFSTQYTSIEDAQDHTDPFAPWPKVADEYYLVTISNFPGGDALDRLFDTIREPRDPNAEAKVPNPFKDIRREMDIRLFLASFGSELPPTDGWDGNRLTLTHSSLRKRTPKRVWVYFPVAESELSGITAKLNRQWQDSQQSLSNFIRDDQVASNQEAVINGDAKPKWYELPLAGEYFQRTFSLHDWNALQRKYSKVFQIVVWEFDNGSIQRPILVDQDNRASPFKVLEIRNWPQGLQALRTLEETKSSVDAAPDAN